jgi:hypothetical protein
VEAAQDHRPAAAAELVGDLVRPRRLVRHARQADQVARRVEGDVLVEVVLDRDVDAGGVRPAR